jgi:hypothetical protein
VPLLLRAAFIVGHVPLILKPKAAMDVALKRHRNGPANTVARYGSVVWMTKRWISVTNVTRFRVKNCAQNFQSPILMTKDSPTGTK